MAKAVEVSKAKDDKRGSQVCAPRVLILTYAALRS